MESVPHHVIEHILERLDVKTLLKFKTVSKQWKSTIQSLSFQKRQLIHRKQSGDPDVLLFSLSADYYLEHIEAMRTLVVGSSVSVKIPTPWENRFYQACITSCDGLICLYDSANPSIVVNPTTRWHRTLPPCNYRKSDHETPFFPGFGKDKIRGTYKPVWLYNNSSNAATTTTCEVFDFTTNAWRYVVPASPCLILNIQDPVYFDGSLHWFIAPHEGQTKVLAFDLHTETFHVISKAAPFFHDSSQEITMCNLNDRLCVSEKKWPNQVIWSLDKTWKKIYSIQLDRVSSWFGNNPYSALTPLAVLNKGKLLFYQTANPLVLHDPHAKSYDIAYKTQLSAGAICYFPSLISDL